MTRNGGGGRGRRGGDNGSRKTGCRDGGKSQSETFVSKSQTPLQWEGPHLWRRRGCGCLKCSDWWKSAGCWTEPGRSGAAEERPLLEDTQVVRRSSSSSRNRPPSHRTRRRRPGAQGRSAGAGRPHPVHSSSQNIWMNLRPHKCHKRKREAVRLTPELPDCFRPPSSTHQRTCLHWNCGV